MLLVLTLLFQLTQPTAMPTVQPRAKPTFPAEMIESERKGMVTIWPTPLPGEKWNTAPIPGTVVQPTPMAVGTPPPLPKQP